VDALCTGGPENGKKLEKSNGPLCTYLQFLLDFSKMSLNAVLPYLPQLQSLLYSAPGGEEQEGSKALFIKASLAIIHTIVLFFLLDRKFIRKERWLVCVGPHCRVVEFMFA